MLLQQPGLNNLLLRVWSLRVCWLPLVSWLVLHSKRRRLYFWLLSLTSVLMMVEVYRSCFLQSEEMLRHSPPALLIESKKTVCLQYDDELMTSSASTGSVAIVGWRSMRTLDFLSAVLKDNSDAILVTSSDVFDFEQNSDATTKLDRVLQKHWSFLKADTQCNVDVLRNVFREKGVHSVHVLYEETDFLPVQSASESGAILHCYISLLEVLSKEKDITLYLHLKHQRSTPVLSYDSHLDNWIIEGHEQRSFSYDWRDIWFQPGCELDFDYLYLYDVFLKTVDIYTTTYKNLYNMPLHVVISQT